MKVAGLGFRKAASVASLRAALQAAGGAPGGVHGVGRLATLDSKAGAAAILALAADLGVPVQGIAPDVLAGTATSTRSARMLDRFGAGSLAEAAALAAAGPGARLLGPRAVSADGMATAAIAEAAILEVVIP